MTRARLTAILCPSCRGTGKSVSLPWPCAWCEGKRRVRVETALRWCRQRENLAYGGYLEGDIGHDDMLRMQTEAQAVRSLIASFSRVSL